MIGNDDIVMTCILKTPNMLKQIQKAVEEKTPTKLIIESFQKRYGLIFTSEWTSLKLDVEVLKKKLFDNYKNTTKYERWHVARAWIHFRAPYKVMIRVQQLALVVPAS